MKINWEKELNEPQLQAVFHIDGPLLILAGAGSGKTRVITYRTAYLIKEIGVYPESILAITFTNKAANEMKQRIEKLLNMPINPWIKTFHSTCAHILRIDGDKIGISKDFVIIDDTDKKNILKDIIEMLNLKGLIEPNYAGAYISRNKNTLKLPEDIEKNNPLDIDILEENLLKIYKEYQSFLIHNNLLDFDDLMLYTVKLWLEKKDVLERYQNRWNYIMIDEYQDTNKIQYLFTKLLSSKHKNICVVGDDDQSIYGFRGADVENILNFTRDFKDAKVIRLEKNYRSTKNILNIANVLISNNKKRMGKKLWTDNPQGEPVYIYEGEETREEAAWVINKISQLEANGYPLNDIAILYRINAQSRSFEDELRRNGIPYRIYGGIRFYERKEIKDALSIARLVVNPYDEYSFKRFILLLEGIGKITAEKIIEYSKVQNINFIEFMKLHSDKINKRISKKLKDIGQVLEDIKSSIELMSPSEALKLLLEEVGFFEILSSRNDDPEGERFANVLELIKDAREFENQHKNANLKDFLTEISLKTDVDNYDPTQDSVTLMTIHNAKGLEFKVVFCVGLIDGILPHKRSLEEAYGEEEERRLFYVAITRAKERLFLSFSRESISYEGTAKYEPSRFLFELPQENITPINFSFELPSKKENSKKDDNEIKKGVLVRHSKFGEGIVEYVSKTKIEVRFFRGGKRKLHPDYVKLEVIK